MGQGGGVDPPPVKTPRRKTDLADYEVGLGWRGGVRALKWGLAIIGTPIIRRCIRLIAVGSFSLTKKRYCGEQFHTSCAVLWRRVLCVRICDHALRYCTYNTWHTRSLNILNPFFTFEGPSLQIGLGAAKPEAFRSQARGLPQPSTRGLPR